MGKMSLTKTRKRLALALTVLFVLVVIAVIGTRQSNNKANLRRYKTSLQARGEKLTWKEAAYPVSTNREHLAAIDVFTTNKLADPVLLPKVMEFAGPGKARINWQGNLHVEPTNGNSAAWEALDAE